MPKGVYVRTEEIKRKMSKSLKESQNRLEVKEKKSRSQRETMNRPEVKERHRIIMKEFQNRPEIRERNSKALKQAWNKPETRKKFQEALFSLDVIKRRGQSIKEAFSKADVRAKFKEVMNDPERKEQLKQWMINGHAIYMNSFVKNPSKPQIELYKLILQISPYSVLNYPSYSTNYSIDIAVLPFPIAVEYDDPYWHQDKERDVKRQKELEDEGWKFVRYVGYIPDIEQLKNDINSLVIKNEYS